MHSDEGWGVNPADDGCRVTVGPAHLEATVRFLVDLAAWQEAHRLTVRELTSQAEGVLSSRTEVKEFRSVRRYLDAAAERVDWHARELEVANLERRILELRQPNDLAVQMRAVEHRIAELAKGKQEAERRVEALAPQIRAKQPALDRAIAAAVQELQAKVGKRFEARRAEALARLPRQARVALDELLAAEAGLAALADTAALSDVLRASTALDEQ
jgi:hypothetical protein